MKRLFLTLLLALPLGAAETGERIVLDAGEGRSDDSHPWPPVGW